MPRKAKPRSAPQAREGRKAKPRSAPQAREGQVARGRPRAGTRQLASNSPAAPMPPPTHMVTTTWRAPSRLPASSA
jgi:hypothetical protein